MTTPAGIDLGTTRIKAGLLNDDGHLCDVIVRDAPPLTGDDPIRESDPNAYLETATELLGALSERASGEIVLGLSTQRSSFLLWDRVTGRPATPLISWQDRRAASWCSRHEQEFAPAAHRHGLLLSPHYAGPKLAYLLRDNPGLRMRAASNDLLFGTLDTYLVWHWTGGRTHQTDLTMASRTLMADPATGRWADDVIEGMGIPLELLPEIVSTRGQSVELDGGMVLAASIADQSASALAVMGEEANALLVNLGTGGFVLRATGRDFEARTGYLAGPLLSDEGKGTSYVSEGTINGAGSAIDVHGTPPTDLPDRDPARDAFCLPDMAGVGSPHWRPDLSQAFSGAAMDLSPQDKRRVVLEGILFRVREIMEGLGGCKMARRVVLSGGVSRDPAVAKGLAASLGRSVEVLDDAESTLLGAARLAAGLNPRSALGVKTVLPGASGRYLHEKYHRWKKWMTMVLVNS